MPLKPEFKATTIAALRSGDYTQNRYTIGSFEKKCLCCIGVAAHANGYIGVDSTLTAMEFIGLTNEEKNEWCNWNDADGFSLRTIADKIEAKY